MAGTLGNNPLAQALDRRIRAVVEPLLRDSMRRMQEEIAAMFGGVAEPSAPARRGRKPGKRGPGRPPKAAKARAAKAPRAAKAAKGSKAAPAADSSLLCNVVGCPNPHRSRGYCAAHYQAARKYEWPMPAPKGFVAPERPPRGRPPAKKK